MEDRTTERAESEMGKPGGKTSCKRSLGHCSVTVEQKLGKLLAETGETLERKLEKGTTDCSLRTLIVQHFLERSMPVC